MLNILKIESHAEEGDFHWHGICLCPTAMATLLNNHLTFMAGSKVRV